MARISSGLRDREAEATLHQMAALLIEAGQVPSVVSVARRIVDGLPGSRQADHAIAIRRFVKTRLHFVRDPRFLELLSDPVALLVEIDRDGWAQGDCDDAATLTGALCTAVGIPVRLEAVGYELEGVFTHVYAVADCLQLGELVRVRLDTTSEDPAQVARDTAKVIELVIAPAGVRV